MTLNDLMQFPIISYALSTRLYSEIHRKLSGEMEQTPRIFPANSLAASIKMTLSGIGITSLPEQVVREHTANGTLRIVDCEWHPSELQFIASYPTVPSNSLAKRRPISRLASPAGMRRDRPSSKPARPSRDTARRFGYSQSASNRPATCQTDLPGR